MPSSGAQLLEMERSRDSWGGGDAHRGGRFKGRGFEEGGLSESGGLFQEGGLSEEGGLFDVPSTWLEPPVEVEAELLSHAQAECELLQLSALSAELTHSGSHSGSEIQSGGGVAGESHRNHRMLLQRRVLRGRVGPGDGGLMLSAGAAKSLVTSYTGLIEALGSASLVAGASAVRQLERLVLATRLLSIRVKVPSLEPPTDSIPTVPLQPVASHRATPLSHIEQAQLVLTEAICASIEMLLVCGRPSTFPPSHGEEGGLCFEEDETISHLCELVLALHDVARIHARFATCSAPVFCAWRRVPLLIICLKLQALGRCVCTRRVCWVCFLYVALLLQFR